MTQHLNAPATIWADAPWDQRHERLFKVQVELAVAAALFQHYLPVLPKGSGMAQQVEKWRALLAERPGQTQPETEAA
jgi:hypothetical protein